jgi:addiction module HigA family antidote
MTISMEDVEAGRIDLTDVVDPDAPPVGPIHPGEILRTEFLEPLGITSYRLAKATRVPVNRMTEIVNGARAITADTALRLSRAFGTSAEFWLNLQARHDLEIARAAVGERIAMEVSPLAA